MTTAPSAPAKMDKGEDLPPSYYEAVGLAGPGGGVVPVDGGNGVIIIPPPPKFVGGRIPPTSEQPGVTVISGGTIGGGAGGENGGSSRQIVVRTTVVLLAGRPVNMICPHCGQNIKTATEQNPGLMAFFSGAVLAMLGCVWGCCLIPFCMDECLVTEHRCPNCETFIGKYGR